MGGKKLHLYVLKFDQTPFGDATTHWALFLHDPTFVNYRDGMPYAFDQDGIPICGTLFHLRKSSGGITSFGELQYRQYPKFQVSGQPLLRSTLKLKCDGVTNEHLDQACQRISNAISYNLFTENCQEWVKKVLEDL